MLAIALISLLGEPSVFSGSPDTPIPVVISQASRSIDLNRAKNYARQAIETENGGLGRYQAEDAMHGPGNESPYLDNGDGTWSFIFFGGPPGWSTPSLESEVLVEQATGNVEVIYNGEIRGDLPEASTVPSEEQPLVEADRATITLNRAKNYARQAIELENGGLEVYQAEDAMHGPSEESPYLDNRDGTWTFIFFGGSPGWSTPSLESEVTVDSVTGEVQIDYNGAPR